MGGMATTDIIERAQQILGIRLNQPLLLEQSLVHRSFLNEHPDFHLGSNERLEYLGDAVVGLIISHHLYESCPQAPEGVLTAMRAAIVRAQTLGRVARSLGIGDLLYLSHGEIEAGGRVRRRLLAQAYEAIVGAIYLDQGLEATRAFVLRTLAPEIERLEQEQPPTDAKSYLQQLTQGQLGIRPTYHLLSTSGPGHRPHFVVEVRVGDQVLGVGEGPRKQEAEQAAAREALARWPSVFGGPPPSGRAS